MMGSRHTQGGRLAGAGLLCLAAGCSVVDADGPGRGEEYSPANDVPRLESVALAGDDIGLVRDFDMSGDTIYLLDATGRVVLVEREETGLRLAGYIGRPGAGPGEFLRPSSLALAAGSLVVMDGTRVQFFSTSGDFLESRPVTLPCVMMMPAISPAREGLFLHGGCLQRGVATDTMKAVLAWSEDTVTWNVLAEVPRFTNDGTLGTVFGARSLLTTGADGTHVFGGGETNCLWTVVDSSGPPEIRQTCPVATTLYRADPPPGLEGRLKAGRLAGMNIQWPETLPVYLERFIAGDQVLLLRPFAADSLVIQTLAPSSSDLAVVPADGLLGCKAAGCVWLLEDGETPHLIVLDRSSIQGLTKGASK
jgi:hypothetical protein